MNVLEIFLVGSAAYLFGSISSAILICKLWGLPDPRTAGSKNPGATNVLRIGGKKPALFTLLGDLLKGLIPVLIVKIFNFSPIAISTAMFMAFIGHLFPVFFRFEGGKGVATFLGCLLALSFPAAILWILTWFLIAFICRYSSLSSIIASILVPFYIYFFTNNSLYMLTAICMTLILIIRHRTNIQKLFAGKENKISFKRN